MPLYRPKNMYPNNQPIDVSQANTFSCQIQGNEYCTAYQLFINTLPYGSTIYDSGKITLSTPLQSGDTLSHIVPANQNPLHSGFPQAIYSSTITFNTDATGNYTNDYVFIKNQYIKITSYDIGARQASMSTAWVSNPTTSDKYYIFDDSVTDKTSLINGIDYSWSIRLFYGTNGKYVDSIPQALLKARATPVITNIAPATNLTQNSFKFIGSYSQAQSIPLKWYQYDLYNFNLGQPELIDTTDKVYNDLSIEYNFSGFLNDKTYGVQLTVENQDGLQTQFPIQYFDVAYSSSETGITLNIEQLPSESATQISWQAPVVINAEYNSVQEKYVADFMYDGNYGLDLNEVTDVDISDGTLTNVEIKDSKLQLQKTYTKNMLRTQNGGYAYFDKSISDCSKDFEIDFSVKMDSSTIYYELINKGAGVYYEYSGNASTGGSGFALTQYNGRLLFIYKSSTGVAVDLTTASPSINIRNGNEYAIKLKRSGGVFKIYINENERFSNSSSELITALNNSNSSNYYIWGNTDASGYVTDLKIYSDAGITLTHSYDFSNLGKLSILDKTGTLNGIITTGFTQENLFTNVYNLNGNPIYGSFNLSGNSGTSFPISWTSTILTNTTLSIQTALTVTGSTPTTWNNCTSGQNIAGISNNTELTNKSLWIKATLSTTDNTKTPTLNSLNFTLGSGCYIYYNKSNGVDLSIDSTNFTMFWRGKLKEGFTGKITELTMADGKAMWIEYDGTKFSRCYYNGSTITEYNSPPIDGVDFYGVYMYIVFTPNNAYYYKIIPSDLLPSESLYPSEHLVPLLASPYSAEDL